VKRRSSSTLDEFLKLRTIMKRNLLTVFLLVLLAACSSETVTPQSAEVPPSPYADTPSPAAIDAALVEAPALIELDMFNELDGWGVSEMHIVRTNDGGVTWYNVTPPEIDETGFGIDLFVLDNEHAWMQKPDFESFPNSGFLFRTTDGGLTWKGSTVPFSRGDIHFLDENNGWVLADLGIGAGSNAVAVFQTTDGGANWEQTYTNDPNQVNARESLPLSGIKSGLVALNMSTAWVSGVTYAPGEVYLYRTDDGGHTWTQADLPLPEGAQNFELGIDEGQLKFVSTTDGFIAVRMSGESTQTAVYVTTNSGGTWTLMPTILDSAGESEFLSAQEAIIYDGEQFHVTHDAARTWVIVAPDILFGETFANMEFVNTMSGWVITLDPTTNHRSLYRTSDGGATWFPVIP
jgi:photosystem II stability/assembly factor-like uncharacterized protein